MSNTTSSQSGEAPTGPLAGIKVVEVTAYLQGPLAGLLLAALGADVVRIERVHEVESRRILNFQGVDPPPGWNPLGRGKRSVAVDITAEYGRDVFHRLIGDADVFLTNLREEGLAKIGASEDELRKLNPQLIYARGAGLGFRGPLADLPCIDSIAMAYAGFMDLVSPNEDPLYPPGTISDVLSATHLAMGVLAALVQRSSTGLGTFVGTSQLQSLLWLQIMPVSMMASMGQRVGRYRQQVTDEPLQHAYQTEDGWITVAVIHEHQLPIFWAGIGRPDLGNDERFGDMLAVSNNREALALELQKVFRERPTEYWFNTMRSAGVWVAPVNRLADLADDEQIKANEFFLTFPDGFTGPRLPFELSEWRGPLDPANPGYGEHTDEILTELGYTAEELGRMFAAGDVR